MYSKDNISNASDEKLCELVIAGSQEAEEEIVLRYTRMVRMLARPYFLAGGDSEDLIQEGLLGLIKAIRNFSGGKEASFNTYARLCIKNRLYSAIRASQRDKHKPLNDYISFERPLLDSDMDSSACYAFCRGDADPLELVIGQEKLRELKNSLGGFLSSFELKVLDCYLKGYSYYEIAEKVGKPQKSVDNAVQRIRNKVSQRIENGVNSFD